MVKKPTYIIGIDEVGRGPIAGPVTVCVVCLKHSDYLAFKKQAKKLGIQDSKKLSAQKRKEIFTYLKNQKREGNIDFAISSVSAKVIDRKGIRYALNLAVGRCLKKLGMTKAPDKCEILLDGSLYAPESYIYQKTVTHGDQLHPIISAASIIAKETRDNLMYRYAGQPQYAKYGFERHVGYGTRAHYEAIGKYGVSDLHRYTWLDK